MKTDKTTTPEPLTIDDQAFQYAKDNGITCTVEPSVVRHGAWRVKIPDHAFPTVLDKDDAHTFANYIEIVSRTTLVDAAKHFLPRIQELEDQVKAQEQEAKKAKLVWGTKVMYGNSEGIFLDHDDNDNTCWVALKPTGNCDWLSISDLTIIDP